MGLISFPLVIIMSIMQKFPPLKMTRLSANNQRKYQSSDKVYETF